jgi:lipopolysaccharide/colanic/teichoic acid biosynthesis glycosyltransferase
MMKENSGSPVFAGKIDETLAGKIRKKAEEHSAQTVDREKEARHPQAFDTDNAPMQRKCSICCNSQTCELLIWVIGALLIVVLTRLAARRPVFFRSNRE